MVSSSDHNDVYSSMSISELSIRWCRRCDRQRPLGNEKIAFKTLPSVRLCDMTMGLQPESRGRCNTYGGTPLHPKSANSRALAASRRVKSAFIRTIPRRSMTENMACERRGVVSLTIQVRHQAAVKFTKTGRPSAA